MQYCWVKCKSFEQPYRLCNVVYKFFRCCVNYKMGHTILGITIKKGKDLGVTISADIKVSEQFGIAASHGNQILG